MSLEYFDAGNISRATENLVTAAGYIAKGDGSLAI